MKRLWTAAISLVIIMALCVVSIAATKKSLDPLLEKIDEAASLVIADNQDEALSVICQIERDWADACYALSFYNDHSYLNEVSRSIYTLGSCVENGDAIPEYLSASDKARYDIAVILGNQIPSLVNLF